MNFLKIKKRISKIKKSLKSKYLNSIGNNTNDNEIIVLKKFNTEDDIVKDKTLDNKNKLSFKSNLILKSTKRNEAIIYLENKYRKLFLKNNLYDSFDDDEDYKEEEEIGFYISPNSIFIKIFDYIVFISSVIYFIFVPIYLSLNYFSFKENKLTKYILIIIDIIYIADIIINFFRAYNNFDENLIKRKKKIISHYLKTWFILDLILSIPYYSILELVERNNILLFNYYYINPMLYILLLIKVFKNV